MAWHSHRLYLRSGPVGAARSLMAYRLMASIARARDRSLAICHTVHAYSKEFRGYFRDELSVPSFGTKTSRRPILERRDWKSLRSPRGARFEVITVSRSMPDYHRTSDKATITGAVNGRDSIFFRHLIRRHCVAFCFGLLSHRENRVLVEEHQLLILHLHLRT